MCGIAGFCDYLDDFSNESYLWGTLARRMAARIKQRGPDSDGLHVSAHAAFAHARLAVMDPEHGTQPMTRILDGYRYTIIYNGELYNAAELKYELQGMGAVFQTQCDTEVLLQAYLHFGPGCAEKLNGIYAFAVDDGYRNQTFLCRDRFGVKPLFYTEVNGRLVFASEIKALFEYPGVSAVLDREGLCEVFGLGPARTPGAGVFRGIRELLPGNYGIFSREGFHTVPYFRLQTYEHTASYLETVHHVRELLEDIVARQMQSDVPLCTFLSGGLDSSVVTALAAEHCRRSGKTLSTYAFDFLGNDEFFSPTAYQPDSDIPWSQRVSELLGTSHQRLICGNEELAALLYDAVYARDLPGMADVDSSLLYFCRQVKKRHTVGLCGECADEIFGGYPWFHQESALKAPAFPWSPDLSLRESLLKPEIAAELQMPQYVQERYEESLALVPRLSGESAQEHRRREISFLNIRWFMATLLDRKDRCSMASGLEIRVPYADHRLVEYVFNTPWEYKCKDGVTKSLLRDAAHGLLPDEILGRKKSPYPKTHNPAYERVLKEWLSIVLRDPQQPIHQLLSEKTAVGLLRETFDYGKPWFGQLMAGPQLLAYLLQINFWLKKYDIEIVL